MAADPTIIAARRQHIQDSAPCTWCGGILADCEAARGKDPTAPEWFGCCAHGLELGPCRHVPDPQALLALVAEIESGTVRTVEEVTAQARPAKAGLPWFDYLNQAEVWQPKGKPFVAIAGMDPEWRYNSARFLERRAAVIGAEYSRSLTVWFAATMSSPVGPSEASADSINDDVMRQQDEIRRDPVAWIRTTKLHRALVAGLPNCSLQLTALAERAKHRSTCPARTGGGDCRCEQIRLEAEHLAECALRNDNPEAGCTCRDNSPEWTI